MTPNRRWSIRLFHFLGVDVYLHYSWFLIAFWRISNPGVHYSSMLWAVLECLSLFGIVLMHEYGHALACRSVGGRAELIVLWPLGGVAYVDPPQRPGAMLWSIAAGPLVNVLLFPILFTIWLIAGGWHRAVGSSDFFQYLTVLVIIDGGLFCFNMLPIYPLDGGQILRSILWYMMGKARSLLVASTIGFVAVGLLLVFAIRSPWLILMSAFVLMNCWSGLVQSRHLAKLEQAPRRPDQSCPYCHTAPPIGEFWTCARCRRKFDVFALRGLCPHCSAQYGQARCAECGQYYAFQAAPTA